MKPHFSVVVLTLFLFFHLHGTGNQIPSYCGSAESLMMRLQHRAIDKLNKAMQRHTPPSGTNPQSTLILAPPANDNFVNRESLPGDSGIVTIDNTEATFETGEPYHLPFPFAQNSVWYTWTAPYNGQFGFDSECSTFPSFLTAYTGNVLTNLSRVQLKHPQHFSIFANAGTTYQIAVMGATPGAGGTVELHYYPDTISDWLPYIVMTATVPNAVAAPDGSLACAIENQIFGILIRTNRYGYIVDYDMSLDAQSQGITIYDRKGNTVILNAFPSGAGTHFSIMNYNGKEILVFNWQTSTLFAYKVTSKGLNLLGQRVVPDMQAAFIIGSCICALQVTDFSMHFSNYRFGMTVFDKKLKRNLWSLPLEEGGLKKPVKSKTTNRLHYGAYSQMLTFYKNGDSIRTVSVPYSFDGSPETYIDSRGNILYWYSTQGTFPFSTNTPLSCISRKDTLLFNNRILPDAGLVWSMGGFEKGRMYIATPAVSGANVIGYKIGTTITKNGTLPIASFAYANMYDGRLTAYQKLGMDSTGFTQYDKNIRKATWKENIQAGIIDYIGKKTFVRTREIPAAGSTNFIFTIFNRKKTIAEHQVLLD
jgi:hypothetical protein